MSDEPMIVKAPLVIVFRDDQGKIVTHLHPGPEDGHEAYGLLICDLVRHVARMFDVPEDRVFEWVERERLRPTTKVERMQ